MFPHSANSSSISSQSCEFAPAQHLECELFMTCSCAEFAYSAANTASRLVRDPPAFTLAVAAFVAVRLQKLAQESLGWNHDRSRHSKTVRHFVGKVDDDLEGMCHFGLALE